MSEEINARRVARQVREWLESASPPPTRTIDKDGSLPTFRQGSIDPDTPFADRLVALIAKIDRQLEALGAPSASSGRWREAQRWASQQTEQLRDLAATLGNASAWAQLTIAEKDENQKLHHAFQAGWEACAARAIDSLGEYARAGRTSITDGRAAGDHQRGPDHDEIIEGMTLRIAAGHTVADAARIVFENDRLGKSAEANRGRWRRNRRQKPRAAS